MPASCSSCEDWCINGKTVSPYLDTSVFIYVCIDRFHFIIIWNRCTKPGNMWQQHWLCASEANHVPTYHFIFSRFQFPLHFDLQNNHLSTCKMRIKHDTTCQASLTFSVWRTVFNRQVLQHKLIQHCFVQMFTILSMCNWIVLDSFDARVCYSKPYGAAGAEPKPRVYSWLFLS